MEDAEILLREEGAPRVAQLCNLRSVNTFMRVVCRFV